MLQVSNENEPENADEPGHDKNNEVDAGVALEGETSANAGESSTAREHHNGLNHTQPDRDGAQDSHKQFGDEEVEHGGPHRWCREDIKEKLLIRLSVVDPEVGRDLWHLGFIRRDCGVRLQRHPRHDEVGELDIERREPVNSDRVEPDEGALGEGPIYGQHERPEDYPEQYLEAKQHEDHSRYHYEDECEDHPVLVRKAFNRHLHKCEEREKHERNGQQRDAQHSEGQHEASTGDGEQSVERMESKKRSHSGEKHLQATTCPA
ncbi:hypothetical protein BBJ28_00023368 [Nothophytophthora sp. Chile5]|nr:hypothetical protein BBJ28_00023368 [Nothophytophthora sp. Chile5]